MRTGRELYVIEKRGRDGCLDFSAPQPEDFFGLAAITGVSEDAMAKVVYRHCPDVVLCGTNMQWAANINPGFHTRLKTW